jgi:hypothetical protein
MHPALLILILLEFNIGVFGGNSDDFRDILLLNLPRMLILPPKLMRY